MRRTQSRAVPAAKIVAASGAIGACLLGLAVAGAAPARAAGQLTLIDRIFVGGAGVGIFDISFDNARQGVYILGDRTNAGVDFVDSRTDAFLTRVGGFTGVVYVNGKPDNSLSGPDGVMTVGSHQVWAGDGDSTVKVIDTDTRKIIHTISTGGSFRADEMSWDQKDGLVAVANNADIPPFVSIISTKTYAVVKKIAFDGTNGTPNATNGLEQSQYSPGTGMFYVTVPQDGANTGTGAVSVIDPHSMSVVKSYPVYDCGPAGLALGPHQQALLGCSVSFGTSPNILTQSEIISITDGSVVAHVPQVGGSDEVWYDAGNEVYYLGARSDVTPTGTAEPVLGVIDARTNTYLGHKFTSTSAHSVAADANSHHVFVPIGAVAPGTSDPTNPCPTTGCIAVYQPSAGG